MAYPNPFSKRIDILSKNKQSNLVLAVDPIYNTNNLFNYVINLITKLGKYLCAIKLNFHVILPLSFTELQKINAIAHRENLQVIADIKLNDIPNTNNVTIRYLHSMGFDSIIVNPFIGKTNLKTTVNFAHSLNCGIISLVYMSYSSANEGFGMSIIDSSETIQGTPNLLYKVFYQNSIDAEVDGVVIGGNRLDILKEFSSKNPKKIPIYSPGLITQGGNIKSALKCGADYLIIGRAIINASDPLIEIKNIHNLIKYLFN
ncbi:MAG: orotidine 5'-phosphate decarboxylase [Thermoproteota archaeon]|nr:orotidine 5'-phosphate decarboxylase [Thermoproteota archaeon]